jgi:SAM-dependent methyltransferase
MSEFMESTKDYWDKRFQSEGKIWGELPSNTTKYALELFRSASVKSILVPGSGYGRHTKFFSDLGFKVTGIEISSVAYNLAREFDPLSRFYNASGLDMAFNEDRYDAIFCF